MNNEPKPPEGGKKKPGKSVGFEYQDRCGTPKIGSCIDANQGVRPKRPGLLSR